MPIPCVYVYIHVYWGICSLYIIIKAQVKTLRDLVQCPRFKKHKQRRQPNARFQPDKAEAFFPTGVFLIIRPMHSSCVLIKAPGITDAIYRYQPAPVLQALRLNCLSPL